MPDTVNPGSGALPVDDAADDVRAAFDEVTKAAEAQAPAMEEPDAPVLEKTAPVKEESSLLARQHGRDSETGKFVAKEKEAGEKDATKTEADPVKEPEKAADPQKPADPAKEPVKADAVIADGKAAPPSSWSIAAKSAWDKADPALKAAVAKREDEVNAGFAELRDYKDLKPFRERASRSGQTLSQALEAYVGIEDLIRRDPVRGLLHVADNLGQLGINPMQLGQIFTKIARHYGDTSFAPADQTGQGGATGHQMPAAVPDNPLLPIVQPIVQRLTSLEGMLNQRLQTETAAQARSVEAVVQRFRTDPQYKFFANVEDQIAQLIESGLVAKSGDHTADLAKAYELACWQHPEIRAQLIDEQQTRKTEAQTQAEQAIAEKAKAASKSLNGSSAPGTVIKDKTDAADDLEADVRRAYRQHAA